MHRWLAPLVAALVVAPMAAPAFDFGDGHDGLRVVSASPELLGAAATFLAGPAARGSAVLEVDSGDEFTAGGEVLILSVLADLASEGTYEFAHVTGVESKALFLASPLERDFPLAPRWHHQVVEVPNYTTLTVASGATLTVPAFAGPDNPVGGVLAFRARDGVTVEAGGGLSVDGLGQLGGYAGGDLSGSGMGSGGGAPGSTIITFVNALATGGGYGTPGPSRTASGGLSEGGRSHGDRRLSTLRLGSGGGGSRFTYIGPLGESNSYSPGGRGAGIIFVAAPSVSVSGAVSSSGAPGGSGGSVLLVCADLLISGEIRADGGASTVSPDYRGGSGRIYFVGHPDAEVSVAEVDFGQSRLNPCPAPERTIVLRNWGTTTLHLRAPPTIAGPEASAFAFAEALPATAVEPDDSAVWRVRFSPQSEGDKQATLTLLTDDPDANEFTVTLRGWGSGLDVSLPRPVLSPGLESFNFTAFDLEGDGDTDLMVRSFPQLTRIYENLGGGLSWREVKIPFYSSSPGDMDGDGDVDLVDDGHRWHENTGESPALWPAHAIPSTFRNFAGLADIDGNGLLDLVGNNYYYGGDHNVYVCMHDEASPDVWREQLVGEIENLVWTTWGDFDGDGDVDILARPDSWYENVDGAGVTWTLRDLQAAVWSPPGMADLDGDGDLDLVYPMADRLRTYNAVQWQENLDGRGHRWAVHLLGVGEHWPRAVTAAPLDRTPGAEVIATENDQYGTAAPGLVIWSRDPSDRDLWHSERIWPTDLVRGITAGSLSDDGSVELVAQVNAGSGEDLIVWASAANSPPPPSVDELTSELLGLPGPLRGFDVNQDGLVDAADIVSLLECLGATGAVGER